MSTFVVPQRPKNTPKITPSLYQSAIYLDIEDPKNSHNLAVEAVAGSGKSYTLKECAKRVSGKILVLAFNRHIKEPLEKSLSGTPNCTVMTLNGLGFSLVRGGFTDTQVDPEKTKNLLRDLVPTATFWDLLQPLQRIISLRKSLLVMEMKTYNELVDLADSFGINLPSRTPTNQFLKTLNEVWDAGLAMTQIIDFDDQLMFPYYYDLRPSLLWDWVFVDEAQDLSPAQIELTKRVLSPTGRAVYFGDRRQAIYQFRGADPRAFPRIVEEMRCQVLPLSICYRCARAIVARAQTIVPQIEASEAAIPGTVDHATVGTYSPPDGAFVLCRQTAPLVTECLRWVRQGRRATVRGRDIGRSLEALLTVLKLPPATPTIDMLPVLDRYRWAERTRLLALGRDSAALSLDDRAETLIALSSDCPTIANFPATISRIFGDETSPGITFSTIHKAKGLEAPRVYILRPDLLESHRGNSEAETNLKYVAITRAQEHLTFLHEER